MQELEQEPEEPKPEPIPYTLIWRVVVGNIPIANTAQRVYVYGFRYFKLIRWIDKVREKSPGRFNSTTVIQAAASYDQATKREEVLVNLYSMKDITAIERLLEAWYGKKKKGLKVEVTATLLELPQVSNLLNLEASTPNSLNIQAFANQLRSILKAIGNQNKKGKALSGTTTAL